MRTLAGSVLLAAAVSGCQEPSKASEPMDLLDSPYIIVAPVSDVELTSPVSLGGDERPAMVAPLPSEYRFRVQVPERGLLTFAIGIQDAPWASGDETLPGNRVRFSIRVGETLADEVVYDRSIHVARRDEWIGQGVDLGRFAGQELWMVFESELVGASESEELPVLGVFADAVVHDRARFREGRAVVLISIDTLRRDHTSLHGYPRATTPGLEALAREAVVFEDAVSTSSWTLPAHASLFTSTYPSVHGAVNLHVGLSPDWPTLTTLLVDDGFAAEAFVTHLYLSKRYGLDRGFDRLHYLPQTRAEEVTTRAIRFLRARGDRDFFLFLHYYDPHWHYDPPAPYDTQFDPDYEGESTGVWWDFKELDRDTIDPETLHHIEALYDGEIAYTDRQVERLLHEMKTLGVFDKALIVVTSDHGEEFLEHGSWEHQKTLYEEQLRVPLLVKLPNGEAGGRRVEGQVSLVDVAPTVAEALALQAPDTFRGRSLLPAVNGEPLPPRRLLWAETEHTLDRSHKLALRLGHDEPKSIFTVRASGLEQEIDVELFHLGNDPAELEPIDDRSMLDSFLEQLAEFQSRAADQREGKDETPAVELDSKEQERLRSLGYVP